MKKMGKIEQAKAKFGELLTSGMVFSETFFVALFIVNGLVSTAILFDLVEHSKQASEISGGILFAYIAVAFMLMIHRGTKASIKTKRRK